MATRARRAAADLSSRVSRRVAGRSRRPRASASARHGGDGLATVSGTAAPTSSATRSAMRSRTTRVVADGRDDASGSVALARRLVQDGVRLDEVEHGREVATQPHRHRGHQLGQVRRERDGHAVVLGGDPRLQSCATRRGSSSPARPSSQASMRMMAAVCSRVSLAGTRAGVSRSRGAGSPASW